MRTTVKGPSPPSRLVTCPECRNGILAESISRHRTRVHGVRETSADKATQSGTPGQPIAASQHVDGPGPLPVLSGHRCPQCHEAIPYGGLKAHMQVRHGSYGKPGPKALFGPPPRRTELPPPAGAGLLRTAEARVAVPRSGQAHSQPRIPSTHQTGEVTRPCTCDGSNENCSRCFGTGVMSVAADGGYHGSEVGLKKSSTGWIPPATPPPTVPPGRHVTLGPRKRRTVKAKTGTPPHPQVPAVLILCPECGVPVNPTNMQRHARRVDGHGANKGLPVPKA